MHFLILTCLVVTYVNCLNPHGGMLIHDVIEALWNQADLNRDGHLDMAEFLREFITTFDHDLSGGVAEHEFIQQWHQNYHEKHSVIQHIFNNFDIDKNHVITNTDLNTLFHALDNNVDSMMQHNEFGALMDYIYGTLPLYTA